MKPLRYKGRDWDLEPSPQGLMMVPRPLPKKPNTGAALLLGILLGLSI